MAARDRRRAANAPRTPTPRCWLIPRSRWSTTRCPTPCTARGTSPPPKRANTSCPSSRTGVLLPPRDQLGRRLTQVEPAAQLGRLAPSEPLLRLRRGPRRRHRERPSRPDRRLARPQLPQGALHHRAAHPGQRGRRDQDAGGARALGRAGVGNLALHITGVAAPTRAARPARRPRSVRRQAPPVRHSTKSCTGWTPRVVAVGP